MGNFTSRRRSAAMPFLAIGLAFVAIGITQENAFLYAGIAFLVVAAVRGWSARSK